MICQYVYKKGVLKNTKCERIDCKIHLSPPPTDSEIEALRSKILKSDTTLENKLTMMKRYKNMIKSDSDSSEFYKNKMFLDTCTDIKWGKHHEVFKNIKNNSEFISNIMDEMNSNIHGMENVKNEIVNYICKFISNPESRKNNLALYGSAGVCKTRFIKILSKLLNIPMQIVSLGGVKDTSFLLGHNYTYVESKCGSVVQNVINSGIMNPIMYFDELDKVSGSPQGQDIYSVLSSLTDDTLNSKFTDHYLDGITLDLSRVFYIFTFNDISKINKILLDRLNIIHVTSPTKSEKIVILEKYCLDDIIKNIGIKINITFEKECFADIIDYTDDQIDLNTSSGIRESMRILEKILLEINKEILLNIIASDHDHIIDHATFKKYFTRLKTQFFIGEKSFNIPPSSMYI